MKWIDTQDLRNWANRRDCQETLPQLVRKLIRATSKSIKSIKFPSGENILIGGWDGILEVSEETEYLPLGISLWEFGSNKDIRGKANRDYNKRTSNPLGFNPNESTFIFVTPRLWNNSKDWIIEKKKENIWKEIKVINAENLEEWLEITPSVSSWLSIKHLGKYPSEDIQSTEEFWDEWSKEPVKGLELVPQLLLGGRGNQKEKILKSVTNPNIVAVQSASKEEALAFIIASFKDETSKSEDFFSRSLIVDSPEIYRRLAVLKNKMILIPRFNDNGIINKAVIKGHTVIVPLSVDDSENWSNKLKLPRIDRGSFVSSLIKSGVDEEFAEKYAKETVRDITILRRQLEFNRTLPNWAKPDNVRDLIPAIIAGRWDEQFESDKEIISKLAGKDYDEYIKNLSRWLRVSDSPIIKINNKWRVSSPLDSWINSAKFILQSDFEIFKDVFIKVLNEVDPALDLKPEERNFAPIYHKNKKYSNWLSKGLLQSSILIAVYGEKLELDLQLNSQTWIDNLVYILLSNNNSKFWKTLDSKLPLLSEASPTSFIKIIEQLVISDTSLSSSFFEEYSDGVFPISYHTGLLWALENLCWFPEYLLRASIILARLDKIDSGGRLSNRPINSLHTIYNSWHYQTLATFKERISVLEYLSQHYAEVAWKILIKMLPVNHPTTASFSHQMRWRMFDVKTRFNVTFEELFRTHSASLDLLLSIYDFSESKSVELIEKLTAIAKNEREKVFSFLNKNFDKLQKKDNLIYNSLRKLISHHRKYSTSKWALSDANLEPFIELFNKFEPDDEITKSIYLFNEHYPDFVDDYKLSENKYEEKEHLIYKRRKEFIEKIYTLNGLEKIIEISKSVNLKGIFGVITAEVVSQKDEVLRIAVLLKSEDNLDFAYNFFWKTNQINNKKWISDFFSELQSLNFDFISLARFLICIEQNKKLWEFIEKTPVEIQRYYWLNIKPQIYHIDINQRLEAIEYFLKYKRYFSALDMCSQDIEKIPSKVLVNVLKKVVREKAEEPIRIDKYKINKIFKALDKKKEISEQVLFELEWLYLDLLTSYMNERTPKSLHKEISKDPSFFINLLKWIYKSESDNEKEIEILSKEQITNRAKKAYSLLDNWKGVPGLDDSNNIDYEFLLSWVKRALELADECDRTKIANNYIGKALAQLQLTDENWPKEEICKIIEYLNSEEVNLSFRIGIRNNRGTTTRGAFEGGKQERKLGEFFKNHSARLKNSFPLVSGILNDLSMDYIAEAKREDDLAEIDKLEY